MLRQAALVEEEQLPDNGVIFVGSRSVLYGQTLASKKQFVITNCEQAPRSLKREYRGGWETSV